MFEFYQYSPDRHNDPPSAPTQPYEPMRDVSEMSLLVWGEHCVECAAPDCFATCDLYDKRPDHRCRRFQFGAYRNTRFASLRGYGAEVVFKKWGKIEARGNTRLMPVGRVLRAEAAVGLGARAANLAGRVVRSVTGGIEWGYVAHVLLERASRRMHLPESLPDAFLLEVYNPGARAVRLQLLMTPSQEQRKAAGLVKILPGFANTVELKPGYSRYVFERRLFQAVVAGGAFDVSMIPEADSSARLVFLAADFVKFSKPAAGSTPKAKDVKCVVWDLDGTLWDGVLVETDDVRLKPGMRELLEWLDERGVLLSIASKNDRDSAMRKLEQLDLADLFLYPKIDWLPKGRNIRQLAADLNIGIDTFAFIDDNPFEREEVSKTAPEVRVLDAAGYLSLRHDPAFQGSSSADARNRRLYYREAIVREQAQSEFGGDYLQFLASCDIVLEIDEYSPGEGERVAELVQRTNQLNFSGRKYTRQDMDTVLADPSLRKFVLRCSDKFGTYGTIGFGVVEFGDAIEVKDLMLSCRVQAKFLEQAFFQFLRTTHGSNAPIRVNYKSTDRNKPALNVLEAMRFAPLPEGGMGLGSDADLACDFIQVRVGARSAAAVA